VTDLDADRYLARIGLEREDVADGEGGDGSEGRDGGEGDGGDAGESVAKCDHETLARLQSAHARSVPFETLSITGDPHGDYDGEPIELAIPALYDKLVDRERGGFCYELNGAFAWLLGELGFEVRRCAARVADGDGGYGVPADHLTSIVTLEEDGRSDDPDGPGVGGADGHRYLVDVGVGAPVIRRPVPLDGSVVSNGVGIDWRLVSSERPDADYRLEYRDRAGADDPEWTSRYILGDEPRDLSYFAATCEYHSTSPDSHFTGEPIAMRPTAEGHVTLSPTSLARTVRGEQDKRAIEPEEYRRLLAAEIGIRPGAD
jgi:N-hydroxyarylamine O-acetyltransferase